MSSSCHPHWQSQPVKYEICKSIFGQHTMCTANANPITNRHILRDKSASQQKGKSVEQRSNTVPMDIVRINEMQKWCQNSRVVAIKFKVDAR